MEPITTTIIAICATKIIQAFANAKNFSSSDRAREESTPDKTDSQKELPNT